MKKPITWHKESLENQRKHYARINGQIEQLQADLERGQREMIAYAAQIIRAETMGLRDFDRERFGKKRGKTGG